MSSLLEQAIIDATALKEAALKNAETSILEKYSSEIKEALKSLLEVDQQLSADVGPTDNAMNNEPIKNVPYEVTDGDKLCSCPEENEKVTIDLTSIASEVDSLGKQEPNVTNSFGKSGTSAMGVPLQQQSLSETVFKLDESLLSEESESEQEYELDEDLLNEKTQVVLGTDEEQDGYKGSSYGFDPTNHTVHDLQFSKLQQKLKDEKQKTIALMKSEKELKKEVKEVASAALKLSDKVKQYQSVVSTLKEKLDAFALSNAKLLYTNRVLSNASLNERQKNKIVETLSNAKTPDEAKTIFETLQSAVGSTITNNAPKSLNEAVTRNVLSSISGRKEQESKIVPEVQRMQILAGIKK